MLKSGNSRVFVKFFVDRCFKGGAKSMSEIARLLGMSQGSLTTSYKKEGVRFQNAISRKALDYINGKIPAPWNTKASDRFNLKLQEKREEIVQHNEITWLKKQELYKYKTDDKVMILVEIPTDVLDQYYKASDVVKATYLSLIQ